MGSSSRLKMERFENDDEDDSKLAKEYTEQSYNLFQLQLYKVRASNGEFRCPFCAIKDEADHDYVHLLQHAIRVAVGSISGEQRAKHYAMAWYLAIDGAHDACHCHPPTGCKRSRDDPVQTLPKTRSRPTNAKKVAMAEKREKEALDKADDLERKMSEMRDEMLSTNNELQEVRKELTKGLSEIQPSNNGQLHIGVKKVGELDPRVFVNELKKRMPPPPGGRGIDIEIKGAELCSLWQKKIKDPRWNPFRVIQDVTGKSQRLLKEDDVTLQALKEEWGKEIHDAVVEALSDLQEYNPSGCLMGPELWNYTEKRKASLLEVIRHILQPQKRIVFISKGM